MSRPHRRAGRSLVLGLAGERRGQRSGLSVCDRYGAAQSGRQAHRLPLSEIGRRRGRRDGNAVRRPLLGRGSGDFGIAAHGLGVGGFARYRLRQGVRRRAGARRGFARRSRFGRTADRGDFRDGDRARRQRHDFGADHRNALLARRPGLPGEVFARRRSEVRGRGAGQRQFVERAVPHGLRPVRLGRQLPRQPEGTGPQRFGDGRQGLRRYGAFRTGCDYGRVGRYERRFQDDVRGVPHQPRRGEVGRATRLRTPGLCEVGCDEQRRLDHDARAGATVGRPGDRRRVGRFPAFRQRGGNLPRFGRRGGHGAQRQGRCRGAADAVLGGGQEVEDAELHRAGRHEQDADQDMRRIARRRRVSHQYRQYRRDGFRRDGGDREAAGSRRRVDRLHAGRHVDRGRLGGREGRLLL